MVQKKKKVINCVRGVVSPMLSNIYLHEALDKWYVEVVKPRLQGRSLIVRFADDVILGFESKSEAEKVLRALTRRFEKYGLALHPEKTRLIYFGRPGKHTGTDNESGKDDDEENKKEPKRRSFDFLGFTHYWGKSLKGKWVVKRKTSGKKSREKVRKINEWCKKHRHDPIEYQHKKLSQKLKGHKKKTCQAKFPSWLTSFYSGFAGLCDRIFFYPGEIEKRSFFSFFSCK
jgi:RNA-directed DNA polymerase